MKRGPAFVKRIPAKNLLAWGIFLLLGIAIYSNTFFSSFHLDDFSSIKNNLAITSLTNFKGIWNFWPSRFLTYYSVAINYQIHGLNFFGYHLFNLIVHLTSAVFVWWLLRLTFLTPALKEQRISQKSELISFFGGLIFLVHPLQTQSVTYIIQRAASMAAMFYILALCFYAKARLTAQNDAKSSRIFYWLALLTAILAMFTKEMTITLPFMILLYETYFFKQERKINWKSVLPFFAMLPIIPLTMKLTQSVDFSQMRRAIEFFPEVRLTPLEYLFTQFRVILTYIRLSFLPFNQNLDYDYLASKSFFDPATLISFICLVIIIVAAIRLRGRLRMISFGVFWFLLALLPESSIIPIKDVIFEHRMYLPLVGYSFFLSCGIFYLFGEKKEKLAIFILVSLVAFYGVKAHLRNNVWKNELALWNDVVTKSPKKLRGYCNRGYVYQEKKQFDLALADYEKAMKIDPLSSDPYFGRGSILKDKGDYAAALTDFDRAVALNGNSKVLNDRANLYMELKQIPQAILDYTRALELSPDDPDIYFNRGNAYAVFGNLDAAIIDFTTAARIYPKNDAVFFALGNAWKDKGDLYKAIENFSRALVVNPRNLGALHNRAVAYCLIQDYGRSWDDLYRLRAQGGDIHPKVLEMLQKSSGRKQ